MSDIDTAEHDKRFEFINFDHCIAKYHFSHFVVPFVTSFNFFNCENTFVKAEKKPKKIFIY